MTRNRISSASLAGDYRSPLGFFGSLVLHGAIVAATLFTFTHRLDIVDESTPVVPVDLVTLSNKTNVMASARVAPKVEPVKPTPAPPLPVPTPAPPSPQQAEQIPPPPEQAPSEPVIKPPPPPPVPRMKPKETPKEQKDKFDLDAVSALLNKAAPAASRTNARVANRDVKGFGDQTAMTADLQAMLLSQIKSCWSPPVGAPRPEDLVVEFDVELNPDGSVLRATQLDADSGNPFSRAAADAARRAIYTCAPFKLPQDRYSQWREINPFHFDPRQMMGE